MDAFDRPWAEELGEEVSQPPMAGAFAGGTGHAADPHRL